MTNLKPPIFIIGAARSGTHLLASTINENFNQIEYIGENNELWKKHTTCSNVDFIPKKFATVEVKDKLRAEFLNIQKENKDCFLMEKTPSNTLRLPFIFEIFPEAKYIHIIRDGRDVSISASKKYLGDRRKITKNIEGQNHLTEKLNFLFNLIKNKLKRKTSLKMLIKQMPRYLGMILSTLGIKKKSLWGPRFPCMNYFYKNYSLLELSAIQWQISVCHTKNFLDSNNEIDYIEIKYENLLKDPEFYLKKTFDFLNLDYSTINYNLVNSKSNWKDKLTLKEKESISQYIEFTLKNLDYDSTFDN